MIYVVLSLYSLSLNEVSELLIKCQRKDPLFFPDNPFQAFHPNVVDDIISCICEKTGTEEDLKSSYLFLLLISGRIRYFNLKDVILDHEDSEEIFSDLQPNSEKLRSIKIRHFSFLRYPWISSTFGTLLRSAKDLVTLESSINFHLSELSSCVNLQTLTINFILTDRLCSFLYVDDVISYNHSLKRLKIIQIQNKSDFYLDIAKILQYCIEIVEIDYDVSQSLVYLHENEIATTYKLQMTTLGDSAHNHCATERIIQIASLHCPNLRIVDVSWPDNSAIKALSNFSYIVDLTLSEPIGSNVDFHEGIGPLLETHHFGRNLKSIILFFFSEIDFACIGACCPNLEELHVEYVTENNVFHFTANSFKKLVSLCLDNIDEQPCEAVSLVGILSRASLLEFLTIKEASMLNDIILDIILANGDAFSKIKTLNVDNCNLTISGFKRFLQAMVSLEYITFSSLLISSEDRDRILKDLDVTHIE